MGSAWQMLGRRIAKGPPTQPAHRGGLWSVEVFEDLKQK